MDALVIWGEDDHEKRARAIATTYNTTAQSVKTKPTKIKALGTLIFWGHGDPISFCGLKAAEFLDLISSWKKLNPKLRTVEILTCNSRHRQGGYSDSYTEQVVTKLSSEHTDIRFRALPVAVATIGQCCQFSILKWHPATATWAYIGAVGTDDKIMWKAAAHLEDFMPPRGDYAGYARATAAFNAFNGRTLTDAFAVKRKFTKKEVDDYNDSLKLIKDNCVIIGGTLSMLRWHMTDIK